MTRAVVRKSSLADDDWFIDRSTDWWEEQHDKMTTSALWIPITVIIFQDKKDMVHLCHNAVTAMTVIKFQDRNNDKNSGIHQFIAMYNIKWIRACVFSTFSTVLSKRTYLCYNWTGWPEADEVRRDIATCCLRSGMPLKIDLPEQVYTQCAGTTRRSIYCHP